MAKVPMKDFLCAIKFLTIFPIDPRNKIIPLNMGLTMVWFPAVGLLIGAFLVAVYFILMKWFPYSVADALVLIVYIAITGGLHLDGLADSCDGIFGGYDKEKRLEIMRQSTIGTFGVLGLICIVGIKYVCLHSLIYEGVAWTNLFVREGSFWFSQKCVALFLMPAVGRWTQVLASALSTYARNEEGAGKVFIDNVRLRHAIYSVLFPLVPLWFFCRINGLITFAIVIFIALLIIRYLKGKIGGMTGDTLGAVNEISEVVFLLCFLSIR
ncbi:MAG: adenosylcobinamide-GDP ribazoletransferase [Planctomycetes bacterium]|nr:adenosylcobinamide-GDP ribazoletransferase [Planctomycetota bacterium]